MMTARGVGRVVYEVVGKMGLFGEEGRTAAMGDGGGERELILLVVDILEAAEWRMRSRDMQGYAPTEA
tara:strand:- start:7944 stop:8147 length:204 start_codon:yes stop_codon:yes gene_type:complete